MFRYLAIKESIRYPQLVTSRRACCALAAIWFLAACIAAFPVLLSDLTLHDDVKNGDDEGGGKRGVGGGAKGGNQTPRIRDMFDQGNGRGGGNISFINSYNASHGNNSEGEEEEEEPVGDCQTIFNLPYSLISSAFSFYIPAFVMSSVYAKVRRK